MQAYEPNTLLLDNALATMGAGLPSAIAVAILYPEKKVVAVCGDGGFMMNSQACTYIYTYLSLFSAFGISWELGVFINYATGIKLEI